MYCVYICTILRGQFKGTTSAIIVYGTVADCSECIATYNALVVVLQTTTSALYVIMHQPQCNNYTDIALSAFLCSIGQVLATETTTTPHLIGGKRLYKSLEFFYSLACKSQLWAITSLIRIMFTKQPIEIEKANMVATILVQIILCINILIHLTSLVPSESRLNSSQFQQILN